MIDRTTMGVVSWSKEEGTKSEIREVLYDDYDTYEQLPRPVQSDETREEFERYKEWRKNLMRQRLC